MYGTVLIKVYNTVRGLFYSFKVFYESHNLVITLSVVMKSNAEGRYAECHYDDCRGARKNGASRLP